MMKQRFFFETIIAFSIFVISALSISLIILSIDVGNKKAEIQKVKLCTTPQCVSTAARFIKSMNISVDPCKNFFQFVCGNYAQNQHLPMAMFDYGTFGEIDEQKYSRLRILLEEEHHSDLEAVKKAKKMFRICMTEIINLRLLLTVWEELGWCPRQSNQSIPESDYLSKLIGQINRMGLKCDLLSVSVITDKEDRTSMKILIEESFDEKELNHQNMMIFLREFVLTLKTFCGRNIWNGKIESIFKLEKLLKIATANENFLKLKKLTLRNLKQNVTKNKINWEVLLNEIFKGIRSINDSEIIYLRNEDYFQKLSTILEQFEESVIFNYIKWKAIQNLPFVDFAFQLTHYYDMNSRWFYCIEDTAKAFHFAVSRMYIDKHVDKAARNLTRKMTEELFHAYRDTIKNSKWLHEKSITNAIENLNSITIKIGFPDWILNDTKLNTYYENDTVYVSHLANVLMGCHTAQIVELQKVTKPFNPSEWTVDTLKANAFYEPNDHSINFPIITLREPLVDSLTPQAVNFGALGCIIGHEITHAFLENAYSPNWLNIADEIGYGDKKSCYITQFNKFCLEGSATECISGRDTCDENIADDAGLKTSFSAYKHWIARQGSEKSLPGLEQYSPEQLFFISFAYSMCDSERLVINEFDSHSPKMFRVLGSFENFHSFSNAFSCRDHSNERSPCNLW